jgi:hypothetical protein
MTQVDELRSATRSEQGLTAEASRVFRVWTIDPRAALAAAGVPLEGAPHPADGTIVANSRVAMREEAHAACLVTINYERLPFGDQGGSELQVFDTVNSLGRVSTDISSDIAATTYPILRARRIQAVSATPADPPEPDRLGWAAVDGSATRVRTTVTIRTAFQMSYMPSLAGLFAAFRPVTEQTNRLHFIDGKLYLFACRVLNQATEPDGLTPQSEVWNAEYSWTFDPGVRVPQALPSGWVPLAGDAIGSEDIRLPSLQLPASVPDGGTRYIVPPYSDVLHGPLELAAGDQLAPEFLAKLNHDVDANGYTNLPGLGA